MRVLMLTQFYPPGGGGQERHVRDLAHALAARGHNIELVTIATSGDSGTTTDGPLVLHRLRTTSQRVPHIYETQNRPHAPPLPDPELRAGIARLLSGNRFDVAHAHDWIVNSLIGPSRHTRTPVVLTMHDYSHVCATKRMMRGERVCPGPAPLACLRCASVMYGRVVGPGVALANLAWRHAREKSVATFVPVSPIVAARTDLTRSGHYEVIPNFIPDDILVDPDSLESIDPPGGPMVFVGDVTMDKGVGVLFAAYRQMRHAPPLVLAGTVQADAPVERPPGVELLGLTRPDVVLELVRAASVVVVPSIVLDACPTVVLEAMAAGRPVVASSSGGIVDLVEDGVTGTLVPPGDAVALADALTFMIEDPAMAAAMGRNGLERVRAYTASTVAGQVEGLYRRAAGDLSPRPIATAG
jgi:glycogen(starch) synthase